MTGTGGAADIPSRGARLWRGLERGLEGLMAVFLLSMAIITVIDVIGRYFLNAPLPGGYELVQYLMALSVFAALPLSTRSQSHLTVSLLVDGLTGRAKRIHHIAILLISAMALAFLAWRMGVQAQVLTRSDAVSGSLGLPLPPVAWAMTGLAWLAVVVAVMLVLRAVLGHSPDTATRPGVPE